jgi:hypothetical protein
MPVALTTRLLLNASRNIGLVATVSARALKVASFISLSGLLHHPGMRPQRIGTSVLVQKFLGIRRVV